MMEFSPFCFESVILAAFAAEGLDTFLSTGQTFPDPPNIFID
ncbi:hypothetical protein [Pararhizobium sp. O133]